MNADLTATPSFDSNGSVTSWELCDTSTKPSTTATAGTCGDGKSSSPYPKLDFAKGSGDHTIKIDIVNGNGITFAQTNPLWIQENTKPTSPIVSPTSQIDPSKIEGAGKTTLKFHDKNSEAMTLKYALNFTGGNGLMAVDPDITNGGKGFYQSYTIEIVAALALAVVVLIWFVMRRRTNTARMSGTGTD